MTTTNAMPLDGERLLQIARDTGLRHHLHGVDPTAARELLTRYADAIISARTPALLDAIDGAIASGASGTNPPPVGHWLQRFWDIGRNQRPVRVQALEEAAARCDHYAQSPGLDPWVAAMISVVGHDIRALKGTPAAAVANAQPVADCWSNDEGDTWRDSPDESDFVNGLKVGDEYELQASMRSWPERFRVIKAPDETSDDYEVEPVSFAAQPSAQAQPSGNAGEVDSDLVRVELAAAQTSVGHLSRLLDESCDFANRYRFLRARDLGAIREGGVFAGLTPDNVVLNGEDLDRAIDAAIAASKGTNHG
jgi:hypothetical protein